jgi:caffeoyl-CoA O-methyltransferase
MHEMFRKFFLIVIFSILSLAAIGSLAVKQEQSILGRWDLKDRPPAEKKPLSASQGEQKILNVLEEIARTEAWGVVTLEDSRLLRMLTESAGAKNVVELGTYNGYSTLWFCLALRTTGGKIITHEVDTEYIATARENFKKAGVENLVTLVAGDAHDTIKKLTESIDILFINADKTGYADYFSRLLPFVRPGGLILAYHTTDRSSQMQDYLSKVTSDPNLDTIFVNHQSAGLGITIKKHQDKKSSVADKIGNITKTTSRK